METYTEPAIAAGITDRYWTYGGLARLPDDIAGAAA